MAWQVPPAGLQVLCDPGTDCADCGPFRFNASTANEASFQADLPIRRLRSQQVLIAGHLWAMSGCARHLAGPCHAVPVMVCSRSICRSEEQQCAHHVHTSLHIEERACEQRERTVAGLHRLTSGCGLPARCRPS